MKENGYSVISTGGGFHAYSKDNRLKPDDKNYREIIINTIEDLELPKSINEEVVVSYYGCDGCLEDMSTTTTLKKFIGSEKDSVISDIMFKNGYKILDLAGGCYAYSKNNGKDISDKDYLEIVITELHGPLLPDSMKTYIYIGLYKEDFLTILSDTIYNITNTTLENYFNNNIEKYLS
jgi:hypothetical protein